jgi:hypothetical protein
VGDLPAGDYDVLISTTNGYPSYDAGTNKLKFDYAVSLGQQFFVCWKSTVPKVIFIFKFLFTC